jgi:ADP-ribosyl-[dinitrogen reductase] hydrolase
MTLFTLEALAQSADAIRRRDMEAVLERIRLAYLDWLHTQESGRGRWKIAGSLALDPKLHRRMAPGNTCLSALGQGGHGSPERPLNDSKGCRGVMRVAPIGLLPTLDTTKAADLAARAAALTHGHPSGYISAAALAAIVRVMLDGSGLSAAVQAAQRICRRGKAARKPQQKSTPPCPHLVGVTQIAVKLLHPSGEAGRARRLSRSESTAR